MRRKDDRGSVLLVALGVLAVLSVFALSFTSILRLESRAATNVTDATRARLAAEAGVERALYLLTQSELQDPVTSFHAPWTYRSQDGSAWGLGLPLERALNPSYLSGRTPEGLAYSGVVSGSYKPGGDHFVLKVVPANARLSLNSRQRTLASMLDALGRAIFDFDTARLDAASPLHDPGWAAHLAARRAELEAQGVAPGLARDRTRPRDPIAGRGAAIVDLRDDGLGGTFQSLEQLRAVVSAEDLERLADYVTVDAWLDPAMVGFDASGNETPEWRAPVDVNTAPWPVLVAVFEGVEARRLVVLRDGGDPVPSWANDIPGPLARDLATQLDLHRRGVRAGARFSRPGEPLRGWGDFTRFLEGCGVPLTFTQRAALLANCDPNLIHWPRNPDASINPGLGKADLARSTTELCFIAFGVYEVTSLARVLDPDGALVAQHTVHAVAQVYDTLRLLTQADFEAARTSDEVEKTASFPNPVRAVTGAFRVRPSGDGEEEVVYEPIADRDERRRLRVQASSRTSGWVQLIADEPTTPRAAEIFAGGRSIASGGTTMSHVEHLFRFGPDLRGELWHFINGLVDDPTCTCQGPPAGWDPTFDLDGDPATTDDTFTRYWIERKTNAAGEPLWDDPLVEGPRPTLAERVQAFAARLDAPAEVLGLPSTSDPQYQALKALGETLHPPGGRVEYSDDLAPDGLLVHPDRRGDLRYRNERGRNTILQNDSAMFLWFKLNVTTTGGDPASDAWTPLFEAYTEVGGHPWIGNQHRANGPKWFKFQVEGRLLHGVDGATGQGDGKYTLEVRSRRWTERNDGGLEPLEVWSSLDQATKDDHPEAVDFDRACYSRRVRLDVDAARAGEWHFLFIPYYGNVHSVYVDGAVPETVQLVATDDQAVAFGTWDEPAWPDALRDRLAPGGFVFPGDARGAFAAATIDELLTTSYQRVLVPPPDQRYRRTQVPDLGLPRNVVGTSVDSRRYVPWGPDHCGSFQADLPAFDADRVKVGRLVWNEVDPRRWGLREYDGGDFSGQSTYRYSSEAPREHTHGAKLPRPRAQLMSDDYARYWRLVYLDEQVAALRALEQRYEGLLADADPTAAPTFTAYRDAFAAERATLEAEKQALLDAWGPPQPPPDPAEAGASLAFNAAARVMAGQQQTVRLRIDFLYFDRAQQTATPPVDRNGQEWWAATVLNVSPILDDVIVPYQERPRIIRRWDE